MVKLMLQVNGFEVIDLGINVPPNEAITKAREVGADMIGLSSLMTTSMPYMKETVELRDGFGMKDKLKVIVGGAPITAEYSRQIGADAFGRDAVEGVQKCIELMEQRK
jgi:methanogenic corrinoid protein MtbC1